MNGVRMLSLSDLREKGITLSRTQLWRNERVGKFPRRVKISEARVAWVESEIDAYVSTIMSARYPNPFNGLVLAPVAQTIVSPKRESLPDSKRCAICDEIFIAHGKARTCSFICAEEQRKIRHSEYLRVNAESIKEDSANRRAEQRAAVKIVRDLTEHGIDSLVKK